MVDFKSPPVLLTLCVIVGAVYVAASGQGQTMLDHPAVIAVVGLEDVWNEVDEREEMNASLQTERESLLAEKEKREKKLAEMERDLDWSPEQSEERRKKEEQLAQTAIEFKAWWEWQQQRLAREEKNRYEDLYHHTIEAIEEVAESNGVDAVLFKERAPNFDPKLNVSQTLALIGNRKMLYVRNEMDLTDQVITRMNNQ